MGATGLVSRAVVQLSQARDDVARLEAVFTACAPTFYRYAAVRIGDAHLAEDLVQQLWIQASGNRRCVPPEELEYWLRGILANLVRTHWRRTGRRPRTVAQSEVAADLASRIDREDLPDALLERHEVREQLSLALTELPAEMQRLIEEHYFHEQSHAALALMLGTTERAVEGRLYRARQRLKQALGELGPEDVGSRST